MGSFFFYLGKFLQLGGLGTVTVALLIGIGEDNVTSELRHLLVGGVIFLAGYMIQKKGRIR